MIRSVIIDDEKQARNSLISDLKKHSSTIEIIGEADSVETGIKLINLHEPDLIFLDINLGDGSGFTVIEKCTFKKFKTIFVTAYDQYAIKAFKVCALDFLLKPVDADELHLAVNKMNELADVELLQKKIDVFQENNVQAISAEKKIVLRDNESIFFVKVSDIIRCESDKSYTKFILQNQKPIIVSKGLKEYEEMLEKFGFVRTHQSHLINMSKIIRFDKADGGSIVLENNDIVPVSQRKKEFILETFKNL